MGPYEMWIVLSRERLLSRSTAQFLVYFHPHVNKKVRKNYIHESWVDINSNKHKPIVNS
jgi:hypothetical protein